MDTVTPRPAHNILPQEVYTDEAHLGPGGERFIGIYPFGDDPEGTAFAYVEEDQVEKLAVDLVLSAHGYQPGLFGERTELAAGPDATITAINLLLAGLPDTARIALTGVGNGTKLQVV